MGVGGAGWQDEKSDRVSLPSGMGQPCGGSPSCVGSCYSPASSGPSSFCPIQINWPTLLDLSGTFPVLALQVLYPGPSLSAGARSEQLIIIIQDDPEVS